MQDLRGWTEPWKVDGIDKSLAVLRDLVKGKKFDVRPLACSLRICALMYTRLQGIFGFRCDRARLESAIPR